MMRAIRLMPKAPYRHENSPRHRKRERAANDEANMTTTSMFKVPPFLAVRALFRSFGYELYYFQRAKWRMNGLGRWVPFGCEKNGIQHTRWVRAVPGPKLEFSDGSVVPNAQKLAYAVAKRKGWASQ